MKQEVNNQVSTGTAFKKIGRRFFYMIFLIIFAFIILAYISGAKTTDILQLGNITGLAGASILPILFIIGFAIASWRFWYSVIYFVLATFIVNILLFQDFIGAGGLSLIELPFFIGIDAVFYGLNKGYERIQYKWLKYSLILVPFIIMIFISIGAALTCSYNKNNECIVQKSIDKDNIDICGNIEGKESEEKCIDNFILESTDLNICEKIEEERGNKYCLYKIAVKINDSSICENLANSANDNYDNSCFSEIASMNIDLSLCEKISGYGSNGIKEQCFIEIAKVTEDISLCYKISTPYFIGDCLKEIAIKKKDVKVCDLIGSANFIADDCYLELSKYIPSLEICEKIRDQTMDKDNCISNVAESKKDISICSAIFNNYIRDSCEQKSV